MKVMEMNKRMSGDGLAAHGLGGLSHVVLNRRYQQLLKKAMRCCGGPSPWQCRKQGEAHDLLALAQVCGRLDVKEIDMKGSFRAIVVMEAPVMLRPDHTGQCRLAEYAILGILYHEEAVSAALPGAAFVSVLAPNDLWYANVGSLDKGQPLCLGLTLPAAIPVKEIVLMAWGALTMQTVMIDERDSAGVLNADAARWWQDNLQRIPLTGEPFIRRQVDGRGD